MLLFFLPESPCSESQLEPQHQEGQGWGWEQVLATAVAPGQLAAPLLRSAARWLAPICV